MKAVIGILLVILGLIANNVVYLQDLWFGQGSITLDSARAYGGILISIAVVLLGAFLMLSARTR
jgi:hypothetical protein